ncbi:hypothetical protein Bateq7PJ16_1617 [Bacillus subtilis]|uniref:Uncharacterized protein n=1 Tax=Bacillus subtilis TaxID=1423 RepID=A0A0D1JIS0_BACIU|nr:Hypothetical Protein U712_07640 [Bacillus subtilis PY79]AKE23344.1 hypothetical protein BsLM_1545 [Bacillus sp. LM 4-2]AKN13588.1 hypothetical protein ABU16_2512 [Bacillus subtilis]EHA29731.1 hypothetical protein BSSC8_28280 [Bacillus subtilis subsp. subtilis str. SC-8]EME06913.1 hypothetical protein BS732_2241 [Bacillus subtilis MB73/2]CCU58020.1 hypothetical protein BSUBE1_1389 [Bacillus subtilis E1]BAI85072.1 hypothetical protein BSNT_07953 [Bacillus subtilis subsp. natto BEST195]GAK79
MLDSLILLYSKTEYKESLEQNKDLSKSERSLVRQLLSYGAFRSIVF